MQRNQPNEHRLRSIFNSNRANSQTERLEIANIYRRTNFGFGKESKYKNFWQYRYSVKQQDIDHKWSVQITLTNKNIHQKKKEKIFSSLSLSRISLSVGVVVTLFCTRARRIVYRIKKYEGDDDAISRRGTTRSGREEQAESASMRD